MKDLNLFRSKIAPTWCPGCGDFMIMASLQKLLAEKDILPSGVVICYDIGCCGNMADFLKTYGLHTLHGRTVAVAVGIKYYKPELPVIVIGGDGGLYGEGLSHLITAARENIGIKVLACNNLLYSLTTGQASPTTPKGIKTKSTPFGVDLVALKPVELVKSINSEIWVGGAKTAEPDELYNKMKEMFEFKGFGLLDIDQVCVTFRSKMIG